jgi:hypothetical protein
MRIENTLKMMVKFVVRCAGRGEQIRKAGGGSEEGRVCVFLGTDGEARDTANRAVDNDLPRIAVRRPQCKFT